jgi:hypothetical protein
VWAAAALLSSNTICTNVFKSLGDWAKAKREEVKTSPRAARLRSQQVPPDFVLRNKITILIDVHSISAPHRRRWIRKKLRKFSTHFPTLAREYK